MERQNLKECVDFSKNVGWHKEEFLDFKKISGRISWFQKNWILTYDHGLLISKDVETTFYITAWIRWYEGKTYIMYSLQVSLILW